MFPILLLGINKSCFSVSIILSKKRKAKIFPHHSSPSGTLQQCRYPWSVAAINLWVLGHRSMADMFDSGCISHIVLPVTRSYAVRKFGEEFSRSYKRYFLEIKYANVYVKWNNNWSIGFRNKVLEPPTKRRKTSSYSNSVYWNW